MSLYRSPSQLSGLLLAFSVTFIAVAAMVGANAAGPSGNAKAVAELDSYKDQIARGDVEVATFGSGCFWCAESNFDKVKGVLATISGYMGGADETANYSAVSSGRTKHVEVLHVVFDPKAISYPDLLDKYWRSTDVVDAGGQFCDRGPQYRPVIFAHGETQLDVARGQKAKLEANGRFTRPVAVEILTASRFTPAEDYHQDYHTKNPASYSRYRAGCGRDRRVEQVWGNDALTH